MRRTMFMENSSPMGKFIKQSIMGVVGLEILFLAIVASVIHYFFGPWVWVVFGLIVAFYGVVLWFINRQKNKFMGIMNEPRSKPFAGPWSELFSDND